MTESGRNRSFAGWKWIWLAFWLLLAAAALWMNFRSKRHQDLVMIPTDRFILESFGGAVCFEIFLPSPDPIGDLGTTKSKFIHTVTFEREVSYPMLSYTKRKLGHTNGYQIAVSWLLFAGAFGIGGFWPFLRPRLLATRR